MKQILKILLFCIMLLMLHELFAETESATLSWQKQFFYDGWVKTYSSSELDKVNPFEEIGKYNASNLFDRNNRTAWAEGISGDGIGEVVYFTIGKKLKKNIFIENGYQKSESLFEKNNRIKTAKLTIFVTFMLPFDVTEIGSYLQCRQYDEQKVISLLDNYGYQKIKFPFDQERVSDFSAKTIALFEKDYREEIERRNDYTLGFSIDCYTGYVIRLEILDVYKGSKWDDTCLTDIWFSSKDEIKRIPLNQTITSVFQNEDGYIDINTDKQENISLISITELTASEPFTFEIMQVSPDMEWVQIDQIFGHAGTGRVEEINHLYSVRLRRRVDYSLMPGVFGIHGFATKNNGLYVNTNMGLISLRKILQKLERNILLNDE
ncbi:MAG: hypothetical protein U9P73_10760 [Candidatus Cloacimonadota bacterium]|nr:hypothetical protein [Candidatus Cloacimonadota bacterium]